MKEQFVDAIKNIVPEECFVTLEPMCNHTTFKIGGDADIFIRPYEEIQVAQLVKLCLDNEVPYFILGNGSNLLVGDGGFRGVVIQLFNNFNQIEVCDNVIKAQAGALLSRVANMAKENSLAGMEFAAGIPGTIGGACNMNAGAYGGEMKDIVETATILTKTGEIVTVTNEQIEFEYRNSKIAKQGDIVLEVTLKLQYGEIDSIIENMTKYADARKEKQPLEYPSAGSTFKRPTGYYAGKLIMDSGLRGFSYGGAKVSDKHCGFIINYNHATAKDVATLIEQVKEKVKDKFGVELETEVKKIGEFY